MSRRWVADGALLAVVAIWGGTFVMVKEAVTTFPVFAFLFIRFLVAFTSLLLLTPWMERMFPTFAPSPTRRGGRAFIAGLLLGMVLTAGYAFQTFGLRYTTPAKAGFITGLSVVIVPALSAPMPRRSPGKYTWLGVLSATVGLAILSLQRNVRPQLGDVLVFFCAIAFALHILITGMLARGHAPLRLTLGQLGMTALLSGGATWWWERPWPPVTGHVLWAALFTGVLASTVAFTVQTLAQRHTSPSHTALIFSMEPVFAALFSFLLAAEAITLRVIVGGAFIILGMIIAEVKGEDGE